MPVNRQPPVGGSVQDVVDFDLEVNRQDRAEATLRSKSLTVAQGKTLTAQGFWARSPVNVTLQETTEAFNIAQAGASSIVRLTAASSGLNIRGIGARPHVSVMIVNVGSDSITFVHNNTAAKEADRLRLTGAANVVLATDQAIHLWYDNETEVWRQL